MKAWRSIAASMAMSALVSTAPARADLPVIDPSNLAQNVIQAAHALEQIHNQIAQIEQQARMLAKNPLQLSPELSASIGQARDLFNAARGIAFEVDRVSEEVKNLYPDTFRDFDLASVGARTDQWLAEDRTSLERAMRAEAQAVHSIEMTRDRIDQALSASAGSDGQTGATQAGNQLLGINAAQLAEIHALLVAQGRALTTERLERVAREQQAREIQRRAFPTKGAGDLRPAQTAF